MSQYYRYTEKGVPFGWRPDDSGVKKDIKKGKTVMGRAGKSEAPEGYYMAGTTVRSNKAGDRTYNIYKKLDQPKSEKKSKPKNNQPQQNKQQTKAAPVTEPTNQYQSQINDILAGINNLTNQQTLPSVSGTPDLRTADPNADAIASLSQRLADQQASFENQLAQIAQQQAQAQAEAERKAREQEQKRQMEARVAQANMTRSGSAADFRIGSGTPRDQYGTDFFKRRGRPQTSANTALMPFISGQTINI